MRWLLLGPLAVAVEGPACCWPWPWPLFRAPHPGTRWRLALTLEPRVESGREGPLCFDGQRYTGPGFELWREGQGYRAAVATPVASMGALAAALVDSAPEGPFALVHAALLSVGGGGVLVLGQSGAGKSTLAARQGRRTLGSNAALLWERDGRVWASPLPLTGHGDAAVGQRSVRVVGAWVLGATRPRYTGAGAVACWLSALATARGGAPPFLAAARLARLIEPRGARGPVRGSA